MAKRVLLHVNYTSLKVTLKKSKVTFPTPSDQLHYDMI